jgi:hypothetical protein
LDLLLVFRAKGGWHRFDFLHAFHVSQPSWSSARKVDGTDLIFSIFPRLSILPRERWVAPI